MDIIDFLQHKNIRDEAQFMKLFTKAHSLDERLDALIASQRVQLDDHPRFLAFLAYLQMEQIEPKTLFYDVIHLPKFQFEATYAMNWAQVVKLSVTFLAILRENDRESYEQFSS
ncbi:MAG: hypothetical protein UHX00_00790 [Caryophanon sp.]|nr:hypothetical protein [Caryophanon sp.]